MFRATPLQVLVGDVPRVGQRAGEPVELGDHESVASPACGQGLPQAGPIARGAGEALADVDCVRVRARVGEGLPLGGEVLVLVETPA